MTRIKLHEKERIQNYSSKLKHAYHYYYYYGDLANKPSWNQHNENHCNEVHNVHHTDEHNKPGGKNIPRGRHRHRVTQTHNCNAKQHTQLLYKNKQKHQDYIKY